MEYILQTNQVSKTIGGKSLVSNIDLHVKKGEIYGFLGLNGAGKRRNAAKRKELDAAEKRIAELSAIFKLLYEDSVTGRISDERFAELSADYEAEQKQVKSRAAELQAELAKAQEATVNAEKFMKVARKYTSFEELTRTLLREFIEKIVVHECSYDENGTRRQDIDIYYSFVGKVELPDE